MKSEVEKIDSNILKKLVDAKSGKQKIEKELLQISESPRKKDSSNSNKAKGSSNDLGSLIKYGFHRQKTRKGSSFYKAEFGVHGLKVVKEVELVIRIFIINFCF